MNAENLQKLLSLVVDFTPGCVGADVYYDKMAGTNTRLIGLRFYMPTADDKDRVVETGMYSETLLDNPAMGWGMVAKDLKIENERDQANSHFAAAFK